MNVGNKVAIKPKEGEKKKKIRVTCKIFESGQNLFHICPSEL